MCDFKLLLSNYFLRQLHMYNLYRTCTSKCAMQRFIFINPLSIKNNNTIVENVNASRGKVAKEYFI